MNLILDDSIEFIRGRSIFNNKIVMIHIHTIMDYKDNWEL